MDKIMRQTTFVAIVLMLLLLGYFGSFSWGGQSLGSLFLVVGLLSGTGIVLARQLSPRSSLRLLWSTTHRLQRLTVIVFCSAVAGLSVLAGAGWVGPLLILPLVIAIKLLSLAVYRRHHQKR